MSLLKIADRYAKSLLDLAQERNQVEAVFDDMTLFDRVLKENRSLRLTIDSPVIKAEKKAAVLKSLFSGKMAELSLAFLDLVVKKHRANGLSIIAERFLLQYRILRGIVDAEVISTIPLNEELRERIAGMVHKKTGKLVNLKESINPTLMGGFILKVGDMEINASVKAQLETMALSLTDKSYIEKF